MHKQTVALLIGSLLVLAAGSLTIPQFLSDDEVPLVHWTEDEEVETAEDSELEAAELSGSSERVAVEVAEGGPIIDGGRVGVIVRGRVIDKFQAPIQGAMVWLEHSQANRRGGGRGGNANRRRVPDPVETDADGRFAFAGQAFRNLRVSLQVKSKRHAPGMFDRDVGDVAQAGLASEGGDAVIELGDLVVSGGGEIIGRVTDLEGNGIAAATVEMAPQGRNRWRWMRNRDDFLDKLTTDNNGYYRLRHVPEGEWSSAATAKMHTEGRSATFVVEADQQTQVDDILLGPGFEVTGYVRNHQGEPIAKARVSMRSTGNQRGGNARGNERGGRGGRGGRGAAIFGRGRTHSTTTDKEGRFFIEHLPGVTMRLDIRAEDYLQFVLEEIDPKLGQPLHLTMQDGLRIAGTVLDGTDSQPVTMFAVEARRLRGLPVAGLENVDIGDLMQRMRDGNIDDATRRQLRAQMEQLRASGGDRGGRRGDRGGRGGGRGGQGGSDLSKPEKHPGGTFVATGLQEGIYEVQVKSPDHAFFRSQEIEVRSGMAAPSLTLRLDRGFYYAGVVVGNDDMPIAGAQVELRFVDTSAENNANGNRGGGNGRDLTRMVRDFQRRLSGAGLRLEARTDADGEFVLTHVPSGTYRLTAEADGFADAEELTVELLTDRSDGRVVLGMLGSLIGTVRGIGTSDSEPARVAAVLLNTGNENGNTGGNPFGRMFGRGRGGGFKRAEVKADGSYRIDDMEPGNYLVRAYVGSQQDIFRQLMPQFMSGELQPDVGVKGGEISKLDLQIMLPQTGEVTGSVMHNGAAAKGFRVELTSVEQANGGADQGRGGRGGRGGGRGGWFGRNSATVSGSGTYTIENVTAGQYTLRVQSDGRATLHEDIIFVNAGATSEHHISVFTSSLKGTITVEEGTDAKTLRGNVALLAGLTAMPADLGEWRRASGNRSINARLRDGAFEFETVPPGNYLLVLTVRGRETSSNPIVIGSGAQQTTIGLGKVAPRTPGNGGPQANPGGARGAGGRGAGGRGNGAGAGAGGRRGGGGRGR